MGRRHRRFTDGAGFTRHCWECANATDWDGKDGWCAAYDMDVTRYDSPKHKAAELCGVSYNSLHASITREDRMSGKRSYCGHCAHYREDAPNAPEGICLKSRKPDSPSTLASFERVRFGEQTGRKPFCPFRGVKF